jgi:hypothetical protein
LKSSPILIVGFKILHHILLGGDEHRHHKEPGNEVETPSDIQGGVADSQKKFMQRVEFENK